MCDTGAPVQLLWSAFISTTPSYANYSPGKYHCSSAGLGIHCKSSGGKKGNSRCTLYQQVGCVHSLPLDTVCSTGIGSSILPADRCHRQAAVTHLGVEDKHSSHPPVGPKNAALGLRDTGKEAGLEKAPGTHASGDPESRCLLSVCLPPRHPEGMPAARPAVGFSASTLHLHSSVNNHLPWRGEKGREGG